MTDFHIRLKTPDLVAWRYDSEAMPAWVARTTVARDGNLVLARGADLQVIYRGEWLVLDHDNEILHIGDAAVRGQYTVTEAAHEQR